MIYFSRTESSRNPSTNVRESAAVEGFAISIGVSAGVPIFAQVALADIAIWRSVDEK